MKNRNKTTVLAALLLPFCAFAHGEEVILTLLSQFVVLVLVLIFIAVIKWNSKGKILLLSIYMVSIFLTEFSIMRVPYFKHEILITGVLVVVPVVLLLVAYSFLKGKFNRIDKQ